MELYKLIRIRNVLDSTASEKMPAKLAIKIAKFIEKSAAEHSVYVKRYNDIVHEVCRLNGDGSPMVSSDGKTFIIEEDKREEAQRLFDELDKTDVEPPKIRFKADEFDGVKMSPSDMYLLLDIIDD